MIPLNLKPTSPPFTPPFLAPLEFDKEPNKEPNLDTLPEEIIDHLSRRFLKAQDLLSLRLSVKNSAAAFDYFLKKRIWTPCAQFEPQLFLKMQQKIGEFCQRPQSAPFLAAICHLKTVGLSKEVTLVDLLAKMPFLKSLDLKVSDPQLSERFEIERLADEQEKLLAKICALPSYSSTAPLAEQIANKKNLEFIRLEIENETAENIQILANPIHIPFALNLRFCWISGAELRALLKGKKNLKELTLTYNLQLSLCNIAAILSDHPQLEKLKFDLLQEESTESGSDEESERQESGIDGIGSLSLLEKMSVEEKDFSIADLVKMGSPALKKLSLSFAAIQPLSEAELVAIKAFLKNNQQLQSLFANGLYFSDSEWLEILEEMSGITSLAIPLQASATYLQILAKKNVQKIELKHVDLSPELIAELKRKDLLTLKLKSCKNLTAAKLKELLHGLKNLSSLTLIDSNLSSQDLLFALNTEKLQFLKVDEDLFDKCLMQGLKNHPRLTSITLLKKPLLLEKLVHHLGEEEEVIPLERD